MQENGNLALKVEVNKRYIDKKNCVVKITSVSPTGWYKSNLSSYREDGTCFHGPKLDLYKAID
jgi:hypothetical protein